ncbi:MAG: hypothetical protein CMA27_00145 [Euryarchaeota archaeon]|nr:hypothetical protein [Euryarchaeota archaeon]
MEPFDLFPFVSEIKSELDVFFESIINAKRVTLVAEPKLNQLLSLSFLEASFLDHGILYNRKLVEDSNSEIIFEDNLHILFNGRSHDGEIIKVIESKEINLQLGQNKTNRVGRLDIVGFSACLALMIGGGRVNRLLPLILAGNWLRENLDFTYDTVFTALRDSLRKKGEISVVTIAEVSELDLIELPGIDSKKLNDLKNRWNEIDLEEQSVMLSHIVKPLLKSSIGVARLEELIWHRIITENWNLDLASQCSKAQRDLRSSSQKLVSASRLVDKVIRTGIIS